MLMPRASRIDAMPASDTRDLLAQVVKDELFGRFRSYGAAAEAMHIGESTLKRVATNQPGRREAGTYTRIEGGLGLPNRLLDAIEAGDAEKIARLPNKAQDPERGISETQRLFILEELKDLGHPVKPSKRRTN